MRDQNPEWFCWNQRRCHDQTRGQLILVGVVTMGILLIAMTLVLNGFLYAQNVESEGVPAEVSEIESFQQMVYTEYGKLLIKSNIYDSNPQEHYSTATDEAKIAIRDQEATAQGRLVHVSSVGQTDGVLIRQGDGGNFADADNNQWDITTSAVRRFQVAVTQPSLEHVDAINSSELNNAFHIDIEDDSGNMWTVYIASETGSDIVIVVDDGSGPTEQYRTTAGSLTLDIVTGSVSNGESEGVDEVSIYDSGFASNLDNSSSEYDIRFENPDKAEGQYTLTVLDDLHLAVNGSFNSPDESPYQKNVVYDSQLQLTYESANHYYSGEIRIAPCSQSAPQCLTYIDANGGSE